MCNIQFGLKSPNLNINVVLIIIFPVVFLQGKAGADGGGSAVKKMRLNTTTAPGHHSDVQVRKKFNVLTSSMNEAGVISCA